MNIKRFRAGNIRDAMRLVREHFGPDAVILANRKVDGQVELMAGIDIEETIDKQEACVEVTEALPELSVETVPAPVIPELSILPTQPERQEQRSQPLPVEESASNGQNVAIEEMQSEMRILRELLESSLVENNASQKSNNHENVLIDWLKEYGLNESFCCWLAKQANAGVSLPEAKKQLFEALRKKLPIYPYDLVEQGGIVAVAGATGVGKTTSIAKMATRHVLEKGRSVALINADNYRIGADSQLKSLGRLIDVPVVSVHDQRELMESLYRFSDVDLVLIDTAGIGYRDERIKDYMKMFDLGDQFDIHFTQVLSASMQEGALRESININARLNLSSCIVTKVDESTAFGGLLSTVVENGLPIAYVSEGQKIPDDLVRPDNHQLIASLVSIETKNQRDRWKTPTSERLAI